MRQRFSNHRRPTISRLLPPILLSGAVLLQMTLGPFVKISGVHPDLVVLLVIGWVILRGVGAGLGWALIGGLSLDLVSSAPFGVFTLTMLVVALAASISHGRVFGSSIVLPLSLTFPLSVLFNGLALLLLNLLGRPVLWEEALVYVIIPAAIFDTVVMMLVFPLLYLLNRALNPQPLSF
ncbi:MAG: rod shape-determining protein MreD [Chloroflexota bacterium]